MKKNAMLKIAAILMVAVLLTTCAISSTFAKYTTSAEDTVTARVAKFGVEASITLDNLFAASYKDGASNDVENVTTGKKGEDGAMIYDNVIAPGTKKGIDVIGEIKGTPEVAVRVSYEATLTLSNWMIDGTTPYCPLVFTVDGVSYSVDTEAADVEGKHYYLDTIAQLEEKVAEAIESKATDYAPNQNLASEDAIKISWEWAFEGDNASDTKLGDNADKATAASVSLYIKQTIEQLDVYPASNGNSN